MLAIAAWSEGQQARVRIPADAGRILDPRDRLVVIGPDEGVRQLSGRQGA